MTGRGFRVDERPRPPCENGIAPAKDAVRDSFLRGIPVSEGIAIGTVWVLKSPWDEVVQTPVEASRIADEQERYRKTLAQVAVQLNECSERIRHEVGADEAKIFEAHTTILNDPFFQIEIPASIAERGLNAESLVKEGTERFRQSLLRVDNAFFRQRVDDVQDVSIRILRLLLRWNETPIGSGGELVLIARNLTPSDTARIDRKKILGFAAELGGETSHVSILARSMNLPAVVGVEKLMRDARPGDMVIVDGNSGFVYLNPPQDVLRSYRKTQLKFKRYLRLLSKDRDLPATTLDQVDIALQANISVTADVHLALRYHSEGIGLFRTELPFLIAGKLLSEEEQFQIYRAVVQAMKGRMVTIRTLDLGGDKFLPFQGLVAESNPFLGWRSIRISLQERAAFKQQLRAILRASHYGELRILYPMISSLEEIFEIRQVLGECKTELTVKKQPFNDLVQTGIMIEVPSAAILADRLIRYTDFFSIGTNDLIQYTLAVDRNNEKVAKFYQPMNPAILRLLRGSVSAAVKAGKPVSLCGEMAGSPIYTPLLIGLGLRQLSMSPSAIMEVKERVRALNVRECETLVDELFKLDSADDIRTRILQFHRETNQRQTIPYLETEEKMVFPSGARSARHPENP
jgi:phosphoenolpyruvate-protein phosphotransferase (PTS system enzyme I)